MSAKKYNLLIRKLLEIVIDKEEKMHNWFHTWTRFFPVARGRWFDLGGKIFMIIKSGTTLPTPCMHARVNFQQLDGNITPKYAWTALTGWSAGQEIEADVQSTQTNWSRMTETNNFILKIFTADTYNTLIILIYLHKVYS